MLTHLRWCDDDQVEDIDGEAWDSGYNMDADEFEEFCSNHNIDIY